MSRAAAVVMLLGSIALIPPTGMLARALSGGANSHASTARLTAARADTCGESLQWLVDQAPAGSTVELPACIARETVFVNRSVSIRGTAGSEIRGSDVWTRWEPTGSTWRSALTVPPLSGTGGECRPDTDRCHLPEQVFIDGLAQSRVADTPEPGQFTLDAARHVILGEDPTDRLVEVTVRERWLQVSASDVTVDAVTFRHAGNGPQSELAALRVSEDVDRFTLTDSQLYEAHGALLGLVGGSGHTIRDSELASAGQEGFGMAGVRDTTVAGTYIHDNNTDGFDPVWEAGAGKAGMVRGLTFSGNTVVGNRGPGLWCDIDCQGVTYDSNRVEANENAGIMFEISSGAVIRDNVVVENGWGHVAWGWGAGILISSSGSVEVTNNVLAWNADGISVISQNRGNKSPDSGTHVTVSGNTILASPQATDHGPSFLLAWLDVSSGDMYRPDSGNAGSGNRYWSTVPETGAERFHWIGPQSSLATFAATPGGAGDRYLSQTEFDAVIEQIGLPREPLVHEVRETLSVRMRIAIAIAMGLAGLVILAVAILIVQRRQGRLRGEVSRS